MPLQPALDASLIEDFKENLCPVRRGRPAAALAAKLSSNDKAPASAASARKDISNQIRGFEEKLSMPPHNNNLQLWREYINWLKNYCPTEAKRTQLLNVLERTVNKFVADPRYASDDTYISVWLDYCSMLNDSTDVFKYLWNKKIGVDRAIFYAGWATVLEERHQFTHAHEVYEMGLFAQAEPSAQLQHRFERFLIRMKSRYQHTVGSRQRWASRRRHTVEIDEENRRPALNPISRGEAVSRVRPTEHRQHETQQSNKSTSVIDSTLSFQVFEADDSDCSFFDKVAEWPNQFPSHSKNISENSARAVKCWDKVRIKQRNRHGSSARDSSAECCFTVFTDPECNEFCRSRSEAPHVRLHSVESQQPPISRVNRRVLDYFSRMNVDPEGPSRVIINDKPTLNRPLGTWSKRLQNNLIKKDEPVIGTINRHDDRKYAQSDISVESDDRCYEEIKAADWWKNNSTKITENSKNLSPLTPVNKISNLKSELSDSSNKEWGEDEFDLNSDIQSLENGMDALTITSRAVFEDASRLFNEYLPVFNTVNKNVSVFSEIKKKEKIEIYEDPPNDEFQVYDEFSTNGETPKLKNKTPEISTQKKIEE
eukprot:GHVL01010153.1.p1 GENE.GHVL01010153.1~~GHVL01010153.1.p1  ORF type:complete len:597 (+),score=149.80 GHVL01010153.1:119-1909(+)